MKADNMQPVRLDHVNIRTTQLDKMIAWYTGLLGLRVGKRPDFPFGGAWLYVGDVAIVHLIEVDDAAAIGSEASLKLEHFALKATGMAKFEAALKAQGEKFRRGELIDFGIAQYNISDPDGNHIHVDFDLDEAG